MFNLQDNKKPFFQEIICVLKEKYSTFATSILGPGGEIGRHASLRGW